ncbi:Adenine phosphoribosyltransferase 3 [Capsicum baccatum]|uniref:adenine phosphoribosyltransferase n=1 Tax=Capsicum baccatum TaxID=33114 RepID=A0A2G2VEU8_CAPBA|nr:Adenine phosphoribosyltransferase 3 [Capsicum baccatum]
MSKAWSHCNSRAWLRVKGLELGIPVSVCQGKRIEYRGFIFGPPIALAIGAKFVPLRKPKKLRAVTIGVIPSSPSKHYVESDWINEGGFEIEPSDSYVICPSPSTMRASYQILIEHHPNPSAWAQPTS